ncbi:hypothetical protein KQI49_01610 [Virgibacillus sp. MSJ-26]|nr:hypothetical protein [Virgibacillus sp. MSJ-26]
MGFKFVDIFPLNKQVTIFQKHIECFISELLSQFLMSFCHAKSTCCGVVCI